MTDDMFLLQAQCSSAVDEETFERRLRSSLCAPIHHTPGDFGLDQLWIALDAERRALRKRRLLRWLVGVKRSVQSLVTVARLT